MVVWSLAMAAKIGSFSDVFSEKRLLRKGYSELGFGSSYGEDETVKYCKCLHSVLEYVTNFGIGLKESAIKLWEMGHPRKVFSATKMGLSLAIVSLIIFLMVSLKDASQYSVWAVLSVVVVFEFTVGATLNKGFNRALGTISAAGIALLLAELFILSGEMEEVYTVVNIFVAGFCTSYAKLYPSMKSNEYGFRVFLLTYCPVIVSGNSTSKFFQTAFYRLLRITVGAAVSLVVNTCVYPIWAGEDLHKLVVKNFMGVVTSLEGCVNGYLQCMEYKRVPSKILTYQAADDPVYNGYRSALQSLSQEENLAPPEKREVFASKLQSVCTQGANVLRELGNKLEKMEKLCPGDMLLEVHQAAEELQMKIDQNSFLLVNLENWIDPRNFQHGKNNENKQLETRDTNTGINPSVSMFKRDIPWPSLI